MTEAGTESDKLWRDFSIYPFHVAICDNVSDLIKLQEGLKIPPEDIYREITGKATTFEFKNKSSGHLAVIIALGDLSWNPYSVAGVAAHESMHAVQALWHHIGEKTPGAEAEAYLIQSLTDEIMEFIEDNHPYTKPRAKKRSPDPVNLTQE